MIQQFGRRVFDAAPASLRALKRASESNLPLHTEWSLEKLLKEPRYVGGHVALQGMMLQYVDSMSFVWAYRAIFGQRIYEFDSETDRPRIIDGGANVGLAVAYWKRRFPQSRVDAFEPDRTAYKALRANVSELGFSEVTTHREAIWVDGGELSFIGDGADGGRLDLSNGSVTVKTVGLSELLDEEVDFLKLDIEGAETDVILSAEASIRAAKRIFVEYHSFPGIAQSLDKILRRLGEAGFRYWVETEFSPTNPFVEIERDADMDLRVNISALRID